MNQSRKLLFSTLLLLICSFTSVYGQATQISTRDTLLNQEQLSLYRQRFWDSLPKPVGWVNDFECLFTLEEEDSLNKIIGDFEKNTGIEIAIITIDTLFISKENFDDLILHFANTWGVGKKYKDNGITIGISKGHRKMRVTNGIQMENIFSDAKTKYIIVNYFIPQYKEGEYFQGTLTGLNEIIKHLRTKFKK
jgi:uncharacterized protein